MARQDRLVVPFCTSPDAPTPSSSSSGHALEQCLICCEERPKYVGVGRCGHAEVCWVCAVRMRAVLRDIHCPVCKEELPEVALVTDPTSGNSFSKVGDSTLRDTKLGLVYGNATIRDEVETLFDYTCWQQHCCEAGRRFPTLSALEKHVEQQHQRVFCKTCLRDRKVFLFEQLLYKQADLERHHDEGDRRHLVGPGLPTSPPHARCEFCRVSFFSEDDLLEHMNKKHQLCNLCERQGRRGEYYRDYGSLSLHYEEKHFVCNHEDCRRDSYRLVAFLTEDDLWMHELKEHTNAKNAPQKTRKHGTRLNIQFGASSYRDEIEERRRTVQSASSRPSRPGATGAASGGGDAWTGGVRFMWTRGKPAPGPKSDGFGDSFGAAAEQDEERYPPRPVVKGRANRATNAVSASVTASKGAAASSSSQGGPRTKNTASHDPVAAEHRVLARLLAMALQRIEQTGLDVIAALEQEEYKERNRRFKRDLQAELGEKELRSFKECSAQFRQAFANAPTSPKAKDAGMTYARRVLEVFATAKAKSGEFVAAELLSDLVLLLPDTEPRKLLRTQLSALQREEAALGEVVRETAKAGSSAYPRTESSAPASSETSAPPMPQKLQALQASCCSSSDGRPPNFLQALDAVMRILSEGKSGQQKVTAQTLRQQVKLLDAQQAESLQCMQQHLVAAGAGDLDFGPMERLMALRPLLSLKIQGVAGTGAGAAADRARCWREWKDAAAAAIHRLGQDERSAVQLYVSLCLQQGSERPSALDRGGPATTKAPVVSSAWEKSQQAAPNHGDFPALPCSEPAPRPESICLGAPSGGRGRMGGRRKGQPFNAWG